MVKTIGNPLSWLASSAGAAGVHALHAAEDLSRHDDAVPKVERIDLRDLRAALADGIRDFAACRSDVVTLCLLYPLIGLVLFWVALHANLIPLIFPLIAGFALVGPVAGIVLYELSRRRERGESSDWTSALRILESPALGPILVMAFYLAALYAIWIAAAAFIYNHTMGPEAPASALGFVRDALGTAPGWAMIVAGTLVGFCFAVVALAVSLVSFPMIIDRHVGVLVAVTTSVRVVRENPVTAAAWGLIVAALLALGSIPALVGLVVVLPILGHATWHLYRRAVSWH